MVHPVDADVTRRDPWFVQHRSRAKAVVALSFVAVFVLHLLTDDADLSVLYVLPVTLAALGFGMVAGIVAGIVAVGLTVLGVALTSESVTVIGWCSHVAPLLLLGFLAGASADRVRQARRAERYAIEVAMLQRDAAEVNDSVVQGITAARWLLESGQVDRALEVLDDTAESAQTLVSRVLGSGSVLPHELRNAHQVQRRPTASAGD
ncbi:MAG: hypothetical protein ACOYMR_02565 [Ilumatobacteraceae bacterium]